MTSLAYRDITCIAFLSSGLTVLHRTITLRLLKQTLIFCAFHPKLMYTYVTSPTASDGQSEPWPVVTQVFVILTTWRSFCTIMAQKFQCGGRCHSGVIMLLPRVQKALTNCVDCNILYLQSLMHGCVVTCVHIIFVSVL